MENKKTYKIIRSTEKAHLIKTLWHSDSAMPSRKEIERQYAHQGKFLSISPSIFGGYYIWFLARKKLVLTHPPAEPQDPLVEEYKKKNKKCTVCGC